jgi:D-tyrosyl-tRNA(Tyr) deacylase
MVDQKTIGSINSGLCVFVGITYGDDEAAAEKLAAKLWNLRIFEDEQQRMNLSVDEIGGEILIVSQFTLYGDTSKGRRPSFVQAATPDIAEPLIEKVCESLEALGARVATGQFRAHMQVQIDNDGPITLSIDV